MAAVVGTPGRVFLRVFQAFPDGGQGKCLFIEMMPEEAISLQEALAEAIGDANGRQRVMTD